MHAIDVTRHLFQPGKHYSGLLHYQGSVLLDSEQNEGAYIQQEENRRTLTDLLVTSGSPDDGLKIGALTPAPAGYDFELAAGVFYLGGLRLDVDAPERFLLQTDYLQLRDKTAQALPNDWLSAAQDAMPPAPPVAARTDLVWLEASEQAVTGAEDAETIEVALEVESSARLRPTRKVHLFTGNPSNNCTDAFSALIASLQAGGKLSYDAETAELRSNRRLAVDFVDTGPTPDPCTPPVRRGFLGAENETIQVRVIADNRFVWSYGNAAPLYRVTLAGNTIDFLTQPRDELMRPLVGDVIELIRCDAILPNGQTVGERHGLFYLVQTPYDPGNGTVVLANGPAATPFFNDTARAATLAAALGVDAPDGHLYARVWRGETIAAAPIGKAVAPPPGVPLGDTGIVVSFTGDGPVGDSWTFSVRPNTPEIIVPWEMRRPSPPSAPRRYITPLGLIRWTGVAGAAPVFHDCRRRIRKLANASGCCEVTVGDNQESFGDVDTIAEALARLPDSGGKICLLRGVHRENVLIQDRENIVLEGCGALTRLLPAAPGPGKPVVAIRDSRSITIRNFTVESLEAIAIAVDDTGTGAFGQETESIRIDSMTLLTRDAPAVLFNGGARLSVESSKVLIDPILAGPTGAGGTGSVNGLTSAIVVLGSDMRLERNALTALGPEERVPLPMGGVHVMGGSERVEIRRNRIRGGGGAGIVLGSVAMVPATGAAPYRPRLPFATTVDWSEYSKPPQPGGGIAYTLVFWIFVVTPNGCWNIPVTIPVPGGNNPMRPDADPFIVQCDIVENDIDDMGESGIAPFAQFDLTKDRQYCGVSNLSIRGNRIRNCARNPAPALVDGEIVYTGRGGIVLGWAEQLECLDNLVEGCGSRRSGPICGFFAAGLAHARIARNRIHDNGRRILAINDFPAVGQRGGIVIRYVEPGLVPLSTLQLPGQESNAFLIQSGREALAVHGNQVSTPEGRALEVTGAGAMSISDNQLASLGAAAASTFWITLFLAALNRSPTAGNPAPPPVPAGLTTLFQLDPLPTLMGNAVISVINFGIGADFIDLPFSIGPVQDVQTGGNGTQKLAVTTGRVLFSDNQTRFDGLALPITLVPALIGLISLDDVKMAGNQCDADVLLNALDLALVHACVFGITNQMTDNRFSEPSWKVGGAQAPQLSGFSLGLSVLQHHNFGSHCFMAIGKPSRSIPGPNRSFATPDYCDKAAEAAMHLSERLFDHAGSSDAVGFASGSQMVAVRERHFTTGV
ncbi:MAG: hypothetical protein JOZ90_04225 [Alphaproteobacteria bacterium]|nr:hypothetical protein [Alphaproteobacteria bacterium]MBV9373199.1 hypothetical protein [Alphaproteobacteria bacterium]MBV9900288.1 hypothetical protein [Alphaproteobacteria bacterium]